MTYCYTFQCTEATGRKTTLSLHVFKEKFTSYWSKYYSTQFHNTPSRLLLWRHWLQPPSQHLHLIGRPRDHIEHFLGHLLPFQDQPRAAAAVHGHGQEKVIAFGLSLAIRPGQL